MKQSPAPSAATADAELFAPQPSTFTVAIGNPLSAEAGMLRPIAAARPRSPRLSNASTGTSAMYACLKSAQPSAALPTGWKRSLQWLSPLQGLPRASGPHHTSPRLRLLRRQGDHRSSHRKIPAKSIPTSTRCVFLRVFSLHGCIPGRAARCVIDGFTIGYFGQLHPAEAQKTQAQAGTVFIA